MKTPGSPRGVAGWRLNGVAGCTLAEAPSLKYASLEEPKLGQSVDELPSVPQVWRLLGDGTSMKMPSRLQGVAMLSKLTSSKAGACGKPPHAGKLSIVGPCVTLLSLVCWSPLVEVSKSLVSTFSLSAYSRKASFRHPMRLGGHELAARS